MLRPTYSELEKICKTKGYVFFTKPESINIIGVRVNESTNEFNDTMCVAWIDRGNNKRIEHFPCTTKAGSHWLLNPMNVRGTAFLIEGQYRGAYKIGVHRGYPALQQISSMKYYRDNNKDQKHDVGGKVYEGNFYTNIHRSAKSGLSKFVGKWSAGCQVLTGVDGGETEWNTFLRLARMSSARFGNSFTYTLINKKDLL